MEPNVINAIVAMSGILVVCVGLFLYVEKIDRKYTPAHG